MEFPSDSLTHILTISFAYSNGIKQEDRIAFERDFFAELNGLKVEQTIKGDDSPIHLTWKMLRRADGLLITTTRLEGVYVQLLTRDIINKLTHIVSLKHGLPTNDIKVIHTTLKKL